MQKRTIFPYRRPGQKKRPKNVPGGRRGRDGGRRLPGSPRELLPLLQPTTKALAQMLSGKARASGQLAHARNVLSQAQEMIDERLVERLGPRDREEFLEQVARLKLTLTDAELEAADAEAAEEAPPAPPPPAIGRDRLREVALALSTPMPRQAPAEASGGDEDEEPEVTPPADWVPRPRTRTGARRRTAEPGNGARPSAPERPERAGPERAGAERPERGSGERLRLRQPAADDPTDTDDDERAAS